MTERRYNQILTELKDIHTDLSYCEDEEIESMCNNLEDVTNHLERLEEKFLNME